MFEKKNTVISLKLAIREIRFHKIRSFLTILSAVLTAALFSFALFLISSQEAGYERQIRSYSNTQADILFTGLTYSQVSALQAQPVVDTAAWYQTVGETRKDGIQYSLAAYSEDYAQTTEAIPVRGRLPENENEIAMEVQSAYSLFGKSQVGETVTLTWTPVNAREQVQQEFTLVGTWDSEMYSYIMWVSDSFAQQYAPSGETANITAGVTLWRTGNVEKDAMALAGAIGTSNENYQINQVFSESSQDAIHNYTRYIRYVLPVIFLCGFFIFLAVFQMSAELDIRFYGRMKTLGMTPFQMRRVVYYWAAILTICSVPVGWLCGIGLTRLVSGIFYLNDSNFVLADAVYAPADFVFSLLAAWITIFLAAMIPAFRVSRMEPADAVRYHGAVSVRKYGRTNPGTRNSRKREEPGGHRNSIGRLALSGMLRQRGRMTLSLTALMIASMFACAAATQYSSFDIEKFVGDKFSFDYLIKGDGQAYTMSYDPDDKSLTPELYQRLSNAVGSENISRVYYAETELTLDRDLWEKIVSYYNRNLEEYQELYEYRDFDSAYERLKNEHQMTMAVYGVEPEFMRTMTGNFGLTGTYDQQEFETGSYVYITGVDKNSGNINDPDYHQPLPEAGGRIALEGHTYTIMGTGQTPNNAMFVRPDDTLFLECFLPMETFLELYPDRNPVEICLTAPDGQDAAVDQILEDYQNEMGYTFYIVSRQMYYEGGYASVWSTFGYVYIAAVILFIIALIGFVNLILHRTLARSREFAVYRSLGMSRQELLKLVTLESIFYTLLIAVIIYPLSALSSGPIMQFYYASGKEWAYTYHFTLMPTHVLITALLVLAIVLPVLCLCVTEKDSITHRLNLDD